MDLYDSIPLVLSHIEGHLVSEEACVVDQDIKLAEGLDGAINDSLRCVEVHDAVETCHGLAASVLDLFDGVISRPLGLAGPIPLHTDIVDDYLRALLGH